MEVTAKVLVVFFLFGISNVISEEIVEEHKCKGKRLADAYVTNKVTEAIEERTIDLDNVVRAATQIVNDVILPQMERQMGTKVEAMEGQMRNEFEMKFQAEKEELALQCANKKEELVLHLEQKFNDEKEIFKSEMQEEFHAQETAFQSKLEEKLTIGVQPEIFFHVIDENSNHIQPGIIKFNKAPINIGNSVDPNTGIFSAPTSGVFFFTFSSMTSHTVTGTTQVEILKNDERFNIVYDSNGNNKNNNLNSSWMMALQEGDQVKLKIYTGKLYGNVNVHLIWTGHLLKANV